tara:strand:- start:214 stop:549 length:336 start_codon:yes stop_codon:yes gene_type:complete
MKLTALKNIIKEEIIKLQNEQAHPMDANLPQGQSMAGMNQWMSSWMNTVNSMPQANRCNFINGRIAGWQNKLNTAGPRFQNQLKMKLNIGIGKGQSEGCFAAGTHQTYNLG